MSGAMARLSSGPVQRAQNVRRRVWWVGQRLRQLRRTVSVEYQPGQGPLDLDALVSPLRYDVVVREDFITSLRSSWDRYDDDFEGFLSSALTSDYFRWFRSIAVQHVGVQSRDPQVLERAFRRRVRRTARLVRAFDENGYDPSFPVVVRAATSRPTATGKELGERSYPLDGCHRLALLRLSGVKELPALYYRSVETLQPPLDNTLPLIGALPLDPSRYYRFVSTGYGVEPASTRAELLRRVAEEHPEALAELQRVLAVDEPALLLPGGPSLGAASL